MKIKLTNEQIITKKKMELRGVYLNIQQEWEEG